MCPVSDAKIEQTRPNPFLHDKTDALLIACYNQLKFTVILSKRRDDQRKYSWKCASHYTKVNSIGLWLKVIGTSSVWLDG
jgi:hypothetical protein